QRVTEQLATRNIRVHMLDNVEIEQNQDNIERVIREDVAPPPPDALEAIGRVKKTSSAKPRTT
ncbi:alcohol dehydrogenase, partial [Pseudomonas syringae pv. tagetis]